MTLYFMAFIRFSYSAHIFQWDINVSRAKFQVKRLLLFNTTRTTYCANISIKGEQKWP